MCDFWVNFSADEVGRLEMMGKILADPKHHDFDLLWQALDSYSFIMRHALRRYVGELTEADSQRGADHED